MTEDPKGFRMYFVFAMITVINGDFDDKVLPETLRVLLAEQRTG